MLNSRTKPHTETGIGKSARKLYRCTMPRYALKIEYDGRPFCGWQRQKGLPTVQGAIEQALARLLPTPILLAAAGRTDTGVHATGQVAHCDLPDAWDPFRLKGALNHHLKPLPIAILDVVNVSPDFHARFWARERSYLFRLVSRRAPVTLDHGRVWRVSHPIDLAAMQQAATYLVGHHDFTTFRASQCQAASPLKTLDVVDIQQIGGGDTEKDGIEYHFHFRARSFLHNQVRSMVGTLARVGAGEWAPKDVATALAACDRAACGPVSPPAGLYLQHVTYTDALFGADPAQSR